MNILKGTEGRLETQLHGNNKTYFLILCIFPPAIYFFNGVTRRRDCSGKNGWKGEAVCFGGREQRCRWTRIKGNIFYLAMKFPYMNGEHDTSSDDQNYDVVEIWFPSEKNLSLGKSTTFWYLLFTCSLLYGLSDA